MKPSARARINRALCKADLADSCIGNPGHRIRAVVERAIEAAYEDGIADAVRMCIPREE